MQAVVLAGGLATRLGSLAKDKPKSLVTVLGRPFLAWQLDLFARSGIREVLLCVGHLSEQIIGFAADGSTWDLRVTYAQDGPVRLGTGGAIRATLAQLAEDFFVVYGDTYLPLNYRDMMARHVQSSREVTMAVYRNADRWDRSNVVVEGDRVAAYDKDHRRPEMVWIDAGVSVYRREVIASLPAGEPSDLATLCRGLATSGRVGAYVSPVRFWEVGSPRGLTAFRDRCRRARKA